MPQFEECIHEYEYAMIVTEEAQILSKIPRNTLMQEEARALPFQLSAHP